MQMIVDYMNLLLGEFENCAVQEEDLNQAGSISRLDLAA